MIATDVVSAAPAIAVVIASVIAFVVSAVPGLVVATIATIPDGYGNEAAREHDSDQAGQHEAKRCTHCRFAKCDARPKVSRTNQN